MYWPKSTDVWFNLPGVQAAYMPIAAPDPFAARQNVAHQGARFGVYTPMPGALATWRAASGWTFNGSNQYLNTGYLPNAITTILARFSNASQPDTFYPQIVGQDTTGAKNNLSNRGASPYFHVYNWGSGLSYGGAVLTSGVMGLAGNQGYLDGVPDFAAIGGTYGTATKTLFVGARQSNSGTAEYHYKGNILSVIIASRVLSPAEIWLASRQMAYCEINPAWNAWARRRRYYYAPPAAAAAFNPAWARNTNTLLGGAFD